MTHIWEWKLNNLTTQRAKNNTLLLLDDGVQESGNNMFYK